MIVPLGFDDTETDRSDDRLTPLGTANELALFAFSGSKVVDVADARTETDAPTAASGLVDAFRVRVRTPPERSANGPQTVAPATTSRHTAEVPASSERTTRSIASETVSDTSTPEASDGPSLDMSTVKTADWPASADEGPLTEVRTSATPRTATEDDAVLSSNGARSSTEGDAEETLAVALMTA